MKISKTTNNGTPRWVLNFKTEGRYRRHYFESKLAAQAELERLKIEQENYGANFATLPTLERVEWAAFDQRLREAGATIREAVEFFFAHKPSANPPTLAEAVAEAHAASRVADSAKFAASYKGALARFVSGREKVLVTAIQHADIFGHLTKQKWRASTRNGVAGRLKKFFSYCETRGWLAMNPMRAISNFKAVDAAAPAIFTTAQAECLLHAAQVTNARLGLLPYVTLGLFCGLRPENELRLMTWERVHQADGFVAVDALTSKGERHRNVTLPECALPFLKLGGALPAPSLATIGRRRQTLLAEANRLAKQRGVAPLRWTPDVMRHTFASHHYNRPGGTAEATKREMGHSRASQQLFEHYQARVRPADAATFWKLAPLT
jgi:site-specific recombinase XerD